MIDDFSIMNKTQFLFGKLVTFSEMLLNFLHISYLPSNPHVPYKLVLLVMRNINNRMCRFKVHLGIIVSIPLPPPKKKNTKTKQNKKTQKKPQ